MSNVQVLPVRKIDFERSCRLAHDLRQAHLSGTDLGSRLPHIHASAATLQELASALHVAIDKLLADASLGHCFTGEVENSLRNYVVVAEQLAGMAAAIPDLQQSSAAESETSLQRAVPRADAGSGR